MGSTQGKKVYGAHATTGMGLAVATMERDFPDWTISAEDRRQAGIARTVCAAHLADLRRVLGTPLKSIWTVGEEDTKPLIR